MREPWLWLLGGMLTPAVMGYTLAKPSLRHQWLQRFFPLHLRRQTGEKKAPLVWVHAASLGEWQAAKPLLHAIRKELPQGLILATANTETGLQTLEQERDTLRFVTPFGFDTPFFLTWVMKVLKPDAIVLLEKELWPGLMTMAARKNVPVLVANARMAENQVEKTRRLTDRFPILTTHPWFFCRNDTDLLHWKKLGVPLRKQWVVGDLKLDAMSQTPLVELTPWERQWLDDGPVLIAASLHHDELSLVLDGYTRLLHQVPDCRLVVAPRHMHGLNSLEEELLKRGVASQRFTQGDLGNRNAEVLILDAFGRLPAYFQHSEVTVMGGTFGSLGRGHNLLEPVWHGSPVLFGPHLSNWEQWGMLLDKAQVGSRIETAEDLAVIGAIAIDKREDVQAKLATARQELRQGFGAARRVAEALGRLIRHEPLE